MNAALLQDIPLEDRLWTRAEVAAYLVYAPRTLERVAAMPGFPTPARPGKPTVWRAGDIIDYARTNSMKKRGSR